MDWVSSVGGEENDFISKSDIDQSKLSIEEDLILNTEKIRRKKGMKTEKMDKNNSTTYMTGMAR